jgi:hypothetical protein
MVGVALQVVEQDVGGDVVAVPAVLGTAALVAAVLFALPQEAIVLEVVDDL